MSVGLGQLVARNVRAERSRLGWKQADLAAQLHTSQSTVSQIEQGHRTISVDDLLEFCQALHVPLERLLVGAPTEHLQSLGLAPMDATPPT